MFPALVLATLRASFTNTDDARHADPGSGSDRGGGQQVVGSRWWASFTKMGVALEPALCVSGEA
ncbi:MAG: hypothetical protein ACXV5Q_09595 [Frankiaceae bacterium]